MATRLLTIANVRDVVAEEVARLEETIRHEETDKHWPHGNDGGHACSHALQRSLEVGVVGSPDAPLERHELGSKPHALRGDNQRPHRLLKALFGGDGRVGVA